MATTTTTTTPSRPTSARNATQNVDVDDDLVACYWVLAIRYTYDRRDRPYTPPTVAASYPANNVFSDSYNSDFADDAVLKKIILFSERSIESLQFYRTNIFSLPLWDRVGGFELQWAQFTLAETTRLVAPSGEWLRDESCGASCIQCSSFLPAASAFWHYTVGWSLPCRPDNSDGAKAQVFASCICTEGELLIIDFMDVWDRSC